MFLILSTDPSYDQPESQPGLGVRDLELDRDRARPGLHAEVLVPPAAQGPGHAGGELEVGDDDSGLLAARAVLRADVEVVAGFGEERE